MPGWSTLSLRRLPEGQRLRTMASNTGSSSRKDAEEFLDFDLGFPSDTDSSDFQEEDYDSACNKQLVVPQHGRKRSPGTSAALIEHRHKSVKLDAALIASTTPVEVPSPLKRPVSVDELLNTELGSLKINTHPQLTPVNAGRKPVIRNALGIPVTLVASLYSVSMVTEHPFVEVERVEGSALQVHVACIHRPGILKNLVAALDLNCVDVHYSQIQCRDNVLSVRLGFEKKKVETPSCSERLPVEEEDEHLKETLLGIINS